MTSNAGVSDLKQNNRSLGFSSQSTDAPDEKRTEEILTEALKRHFKPEFLNRIDDIIVFHTLNQENMKQIVTLMSKTVAARAKENMQIDLTFSEKAISLIALEGYDQSYGARPLRRAIQSKIENFFAEQYLEGKFKEGDMVQIDVENEDFVLQKIEKNN